MIRLLFLFIVLISSAAISIETVQVTIWNGAAFPKQLIVPSDKEFRLRIRNLDKNLLKIESESLNLNISLSPNTDVIIGKLPLNRGSYPLITIFKQHIYRSEIIALK